MEEQRLTVDEVMRQRPETSWQEGRAVTRKVWNIGYREGVSAWDPQG